MSKKSKVERPLVMQLVRRHCVPLHAIAADKSKKGALDITGGSALLLETICGRFFVTASHVWQELVKLTQDSSKYDMFTYDLSGPAIIRRPRLIDECEDLDIAVFTIDGISNFNPTGKAFLQASNSPSAPILPDEPIVGCGYPKSIRNFENGKFKQDIVVWAHSKCTVSESGRRLLLDGHSRKLKMQDFTKPARKEVPLPGISGGPLFALRETLDWVGVVRSGCGIPPDVYSIQATPSSFVSPDGHILKT